MEKRAIELVRGFHAAGKPVAAICHGPWLLVEADIIKGKTVTSWPSIRTDLKNAGGNVVDREVVVDGNVITSRKRSEEHTSELQSLMRISYAVFCLKKKTTKTATQI